MTLLKFRLVPIALFGYRKKKKKMDIRSAFIKQDTRITIIFEL